MWKMYRKNREELPKIDRRNNLAKMLIKNFLKLFLYANRNRNRLLYFSTNSYLQKQHNIFPSTEAQIEEVYKPYYLKYLLSRMDLYGSVYDIESLFTKNDSDPEAIKLLLDFDKNQNDSENENFLSEILKCTQNELSDYTVDEICKFIALVSKHGFHTRYRSKMSNIKYCIDQELTKKYFSKNEILKIFFTLSEVRTFALYFHYKGVLKLLDKIDSLSVPEIVQTFYCIPARDFSKIDSKYFVLSYLNDIMSIFNSDELGIIALGLVRGNITFNHENIFNSILNKIINEIENIHSVPFISVCKVVQKFFKITDVNSFRDFQEKLAPHVSKLGKKSLLSLAYAGHRYKILNSSLKELLINKWKECIMDFTYLDIVRLIHLTVVFNIYDKELLLLAMKNLEIIWHKHHASVSVLNNLSFHGLYSKKLLDTVFSENYFSEVCSNNSTNKLKAEWWSLYCNVELEKPEYSNKAFSSSSLHKIYKKSKIIERINLSFKHNRYYSFLYNIKKILQEIYGENKVFITDVLPHFSHGIVMRFNTKSQAQEIPEDFRSSDEKGFKKALKDDNLWIFVLLIKNQDVLWDTDILDLPRQTQCRQLKALGYEILMVKLSKFFWEFKQKNEKAYITNLMDAYLSNISNEIKLS